MPSRWRNKSGRCYLAGLPIGEGTLQFCDGLARFDGCRTGYGTDDARIHRLRIRDLPQVFKLPVGTGH